MTSEVLYDDKGAYVLLGPGLSAAEVAASAPAPTPEVMEQLRRLLPPVPMADVETQEEQAA